MGIRARNGVRLVSELWFYSAHNGAWWLMLVAVAALAIFALAGTVHAVVPYAVYTLF